MNPAIWFLLAAALVLGATFGVVVVASSVKPQCAECAAWRRERRPWWLQ